MSISYIEALSTALLTGTFTVVLGGLIFYFREHHQARYNENQKRAELEMLRKSMEHQIYELNYKLASTEDRWKDVNHLLISRLTTQPQQASAQGPAHISEFLKSYGLSEKDLEIDPRLVFVLTPFNTEFLRPYEEIAIACHQLGLQCVRGDETQIRGDLLPHILRLIAKSRLIVANIDGRNPNVFYELGIAHSLDKITILVTSSISTVPLDLKSKKLVVYDVVDDLRDLIQTEISRSLVEPSRI